MSQTEPDFLTRLLNPPPTQNARPLPATGRAGRNLPAALGVSAVLISVLLASLLLNKALFVVVTVLAICAALWELAGAFAVHRIRLPLGPLWLGTLGIAVTAWDVGAEAAFGAYIATVGACSLWTFLEQVEAETGTMLERPDVGVPRTYAHDDHRRSRSVATFAAVFAATYLPFLAGFAVLLCRQHDGVGKVLLLMGLAVANDTGGWLAGITLGRHPMAPSVSPKKSWEGLGGSMAAAIAGGILGVYLLGGDWWAGALLGAGIVIVSTLGDLGESLIKRDLGLKDMGTLLPGHGGLLDRLDSILVAAPVVYLFSLILLP
ncbi:Phosphatidate cytidylyltransferase [Actinomyces bovis]|uniref:Phosphatidate cytidylyltransferase n=1 Tax=Actinomyces bovis TaxID=1658 RepID=A0ABY1VKU9_9ACTO|nr:phosphatidate cytidylyltransferase [Actinomyces bovis]SPT52640.1 Phosphatidate cytidylyltransferase [Actinomyces bovis]VEG54523.1 Phosphatidate cytidylyltransferase [Actinomyces israelii]